MRISHTFGVHMQHELEYVDLVNDSDEVICSLSRDEVSAYRAKNPHLYTRAVHAFLINTEGQLRVHQRTLKQSRLPGGLDFTVSGAVQSGEGYLQALARETEEEIRTTLTSFQIKHLLHLKPHETGVPHFGHFYFLFSETTPQFNEEEFAQGFWIKPIELLKRIESGERSKLVMPYILHKILALQ